MYWSQLWDTTTSAIETMYTQWGKDHKQVFSIIGYKAIYKTIVNSYNKIISYTANNKIFECTSTLGKNVTHLMHKYDLVIDKNQIAIYQSIKEYCYNKWLSAINNEYLRYAQIIKDMIRMKEESGTRLFSNDECQCIIDFCSVD